MCGARYGTMSITIVRPGALRLNVVVGRVVGNVAVDQPLARRSRHRRSDDGAVAAPVTQWIVDIDRLLPKRLAS